MPQVTGPELVRQLRVHGINQPVVYCTGTDPQEFKDREEVSPDVKIVRKPGKAEELIDAILVQIGIKTSEGSPP